MENDAKILGNQTQIVVGDRWSITEQVSLTNEVAVVAKSTIRISPLQRRRADARSGRRCVAARDRQDGKQRSK